jgi:hypothetical protein
MAAANPQAAADNDHVVEVFAGGSFSPFGGGWALSVRPGSTHQETWWDARLPLLIR